jgi:hypothetical protein
MIMTEGSDNVELSDHARDALSAVQTAVAGRRYCDVNQARSVAHNLSERFSSEGSDAFRQVLGSLREFGLVEIEAAPNEDYFERVTLTKQGHKQLRELAEGSDT